MVIFEFLAIGNMSAVPASTTRVLMSLLLSKTTHTLSLVPVVLIELVCLCLDSELDVWIPQPFHAEVPADWWDGDADKSLLIGVFKHGKATRRTHGLRQSSHTLLHTLSHTLSQLAATQHDVATLEQEVTSESERPVGASDSTRSITPAAAAAAAAATA